MRPTKIELNERGKGWGKAVAICVLLLACAAFFLVMGVVYHESVAIVVGAIGTAMFGFFTISLVNPNMLSCMQMVKGEMTYKQLKEAVEAEDFERPIRFLQKDFRPDLFLASENWVVVEERGNPIYIPKAKVRSIELRQEGVEFGPEYSGDGHTYLHFFYYFKLTCDEKHAFDTGLISFDDLSGALDTVQRHFPHLEIRMPSSSEAEG